MENTSISGLGLKVDQDSAGMPRCARLGKASAGLPRPNHSSKGKAVDSEDRWKAQSQVVGNPKRSCPKGGFSRVDNLGFHVSLQGRNMLLESPFEAAPLGEFVLPRPPNWCAV